MGREFAKTVCVKEKRTCTTCLPFRRGKCLNTKQQAASTTPAQPATSDQNLPTQITAADVISSGSTTASSDMDTLPPATPSTAPQIGISSSNAHPPSPAAPTQFLLPDYPSVMPPSFTWGSVSGTNFSSLLDSVYNEVIHWRRNCFSVPFGKAGRGFVNELSRLYLAYGSASALESVALKATIVLPILLLQKPNRTSKTKEHIACLARRLPLWSSGELMELVREGRALQQRLPKGPDTRYDSTKLARSFSQTDVCREV